MAGILQACQSVKFRLLYLMPHAWFHVTKNMIDTHYNMIYYFCMSSYCFVPPFADFNSSFGDSHTTQESLFASLLESWWQWLRHKWVGVLFCLMRGKTLSSPGLLCGTIRINLATLRDTGICMKHQMFDICYPFCNTAFHLCLLQTLMLLSKPHQECRSCLSINSSCIITEVNWSKSEYLTQKNSNESKLLSSFHSKFNCWGHYHKRATFVMLQK